MSQLQAQRYVQAVEFERYYQEREKERPGPTPEEVGIAEAKAEVRQLRELEAALDAA